MNSWSPCLTHPPTYPSTPSRVPPLSLWPDLPTAHCSWTTLPYRPTDSILLLEFFLTYLPTYLPTCRALQVDFDEFLEFMQHEEEVVDRVQRDSAGGETAGLEDVDVGVVEAEATEAEALLA